MSWSGHLSCRRPRSSPESHRQYDTGEPVFRYLPSEIGTEGQQISQNATMRCICQQVQRMVILASAPATLRERAGLLALSPESAQHQVPTTRDQREPAKDVDQIAER
jgi:hypothetical protein